MNQYPDREDIDAAWAKLTAERDAARLEAAQARKELAETTKQLADYKDRASHWQDRSASLFNELDQRTDELRDARAEVARLQRENGQQAEQLAGIARILTGE